MNRKVLGVAIFSVGAAIGAVAIWKYAEHKNEQKIQDEIKTFKDGYSKRPVARSIEKEETVNPNSDKLKNATKIINLQGYTNYSDVQKVEPDEDPDDEPSMYSEKESDEEYPFVITPDEFGDVDEYDKISLTYYAGDEMLADEKDELVESIDSVVGLESLDHFGEYEDDSVFVRNDRLKCDYEILKDVRSWSDVVARPKPKGKKATLEKKPHQMED